jgi:hypothetical protein
MLFTCHLQGKSQESNQPKRKKIQKKNVTASNSQAKESDETEDNDKVLQSEESDDSSSDSEEIDTTGMSIELCLTEDSPELQALLLRKK